MFDFLLIIPCVGTPIKVDAMILFGKLSRFIRGDCQGSLVQLRCPATPNYLPEHLKFVFARVEAEFVDVRRGKKVVVGCDTLLPDD